MMINKSIIEAKFKRGKLRTSHTFLWNELPDINKRDILSIIKLSTDDIPIICYYESKFYKWIITTSKLIILNDEMVQEIHYRRIKKILPDKLFRQETTKTENDVIKCILIDDASIELKVEKTTWHEIYNILRFIINKSFFPNDFPPD